MTSVSPFWLFGYSDNSLPPIASLVVVKQQILVRFQCDVLTQVRLHAGHQVGDISVAPQAGHIDTAVLVTHIDNDQHVVVVALARPAGFASLSLTDRGFLHLAPQRS